MKFFGYVFRFSVLKLSWQRYAALGWLEIQ
jgi:hypothetical protein